MFDFMRQSKDMMKTYVDADLSKRCSELRDGYFMPYRARIQSVENGGRWFLKQMRGLVPEIMAQAGQRQLDDAKMIFSATGRGYEYGVQEYLDTIPDGKRDHLWCYGARVTIPNFVNSVWEDWTSHYKRWFHDGDGWVLEPLSKSQRKLLFSMPGGTHAGIAHQVAWKKLDINFKIPPERMVWYLVASCGIQDMDWGVIQRSSMYNIRKALRAVCHHMGYPNLRKSVVLSAVCGYITEIRPRPGQTVLDWALESIEWHRDAEMRAERQRLETERMDAERRNLIKNAKTPILTRKLPPGFRQLTKREEFIAESQVMEHCVDTYWEGAKLGQYFIIHYDDGVDTGCTIQLSPDGAIWQNQGFRHRYGKMERETSATIAAWAAKGKFFNEEDVTTLPSNRYRYGGELPF